MKGRLDPCLLLSYSVPAEQLRRQVRRQVPAGLELVERNGLAFWNVVVCQVNGLRPWFLPRPAGVTCAMLGVRLHVRARLEDGSDLDGLHFVETHINRFVNVADRFGDFRFFQSKGILVRGTRSLGPDRPLAPLVAWDDPEWELLVEAYPLSSPAAASQARYAPSDAESLFRYRPVSMAVAAPGVLRLTEVVRDESRWRETPAAVEPETPLQKLVGPDARLERAVLVDPIDYVWRLGRRVRLASPAPADVPSAA